MILKLPDYAKHLGIAYITAFRWWKAGKIPGAFRKGKLVFVEISEPKETKPLKTLVYCRVSNHSRKEELKYQVSRCKDFCAARGLCIDKIYSEVASGMNDNRKELWKMLEEKPTTIVVENKDRLTRFGFNYLERLLKDQGCEILVMNPNTNDEQDLMKDLVSIITSFCCRLYGIRRAKNKLDKIKETLNA